MSYPTDISSDSSHADVWPHHGWDGHWSTAHGSGKSGKSGRSKSSGGWNIIGGLKPKSNKDKWLGTSEDIPGKELIYDEDTLPNWHAGWPPLDVHVSSSGKSGKSGIISSSGKSGKSGVDVYISSSGKSSKSGGGHSWEGGGDKLSESESPYDTDEEYVTPLSTSNPTLGATPPPVSSDGDTPSPIQSLTLPPVGSSIDGDPNAKYWIYTDENGVQTCEYSPTIPDGIGSIAWARESKKECCDYAIEIGSTNLQGCDGVRSASPPNTTTPAVHKKPSLGAQFLGSHPHGHNNNNNLSKGDRSGATSKSAKSEDQDSSILNPMPSVSLTKSKSAKSKSSKNWDKKYGIGPVGTASDVKYSEGLTDGMTYSGYKQKTSGSDPSSQSEESISSSASSISSTLSFRRILLSAGLAVLGWCII